VVGVGGVIVLTSLAVLAVNNPAVQSLAASVPVLGRLSPDPPGTAEFLLELLVTVLVFVLAFVPLYPPRPRRILDVLLRSVERVLLAGLVLATVGYFDYTYRLPRFTLLVVVPVLGVALPVWFVWIRRRPGRETNRAIVVGDDPRGIDRDAEDVAVPLIGYLCPSRPFHTDEAPRPRPDGGLTDGGLERLGGLSRIEDVLVSYDVDTVVLAFEEADRAEFFGALDACYEHGVDAKVHRRHADSVLTDDDAVGPLVDVRIEPWDVQDYALKRAFDVAFAAVGLVVLAPVVGLIALAIRLDDGGPVLYEQERTAVFGEVFDVYKFRTMTPGGECETPVADADNDRITRVGRWLRRTHLDEVPQLWSILKGDMSVVGPRAVWTAEEGLLEAESTTWRKRWFVKPGLTGLAQIHDAKSTNPTAKHRHDMRYVAEQTFWLDMKIVIRQVWKVVFSILETRRVSADSERARD
jgi:lipopolysaccharide/colanic/teichoic acid biosynthesis glycosyltransferase